MPLICIKAIFMLILNEQNTNGTFIKFMFSYIFLEMFFIQLLELPQYYNVIINGVQLFNYYNFIKILNVILSNAFYKKNINYSFFPIYL